MQRILSLLLVLTLVCPFAHGTTPPPAEPVPACSQALSAPKPSFRSWLIRRRGELKYSQQDLAREAGLSLSEVAKLEQKVTSNPRVSTLFALFRALRVRPGVAFEQFDPSSFTAREDD